MDGDRRWYRYHRLFADFLRADLSRNDELEQHRRAAAWCAANGHARDAVTHALAAEDWLAAADLIGAAAAELLRAGEVTTLAAWLAALPEALIQAHEELSAHRALAALLTGQLAAAVRWAAPLADAPGAGFAAPRSGREWTIAAWLASVQGRADLMRFARQADALTADDDPMNKTLALITLGLAQNVEGDVAGSDASFRRAYELSAAAGQPFAALGALANLCFNLLEEGRFRAADALAQEALARYVDRRGRPLPVLGILYAPLAVLAYARDDLAQAETYAREGLALCRRLFSRAILGGDAEMTLALVHFALGEHERAYAILAEARRAAERARVAVVAERLALQEAVLRLRAGDPARAERYLAAAGRRALADSQADAERRELLRARLALARGETAAARNALALLETQVSASGRGARLIQIHVLQALAAQQAGDAAAAGEHLRGGLRLAAAEGYRRAFLDGGRPVAELLPLVRSAAPEFVADLLARFAAAPAGQPPASASGAASPGTPSPLVEPLSARELEILRLIAQGASNQAIADRLVITVGTAKWHLSNIYGKLGVRSRTQALARAGELGLLTPDS
jgi:LuxR family maltose regulon positive regulatory protein